MRRVLKTAGVVVLVVCLAACGEAKGADGANDVKVKDSTAGAIPEGIQPIIDRETGTLAPGSARYGGGEYGYYDFVLHDIQLNEQSLCLERNGYRGARDPDVGRSTDPMYRVTTVLPPFTEQQAARFGFVPPMPTADILGNSIPDATIPQGEIAARDKRVAAFEAQENAFEAGKKTAAYKQAYQACKSDPSVKKWTSINLGGGAGPWVTDFQDDQKAAFRDPAMKPIKARYVACIRAEGLQPTKPDSTVFEDFFAVVGQDLNRIDEQQIKLATEVVQCKDQTHAVDDMMEVWARHEAPTFLKYEQELTAYQQKLEKIYAEEDAYLAEHK